jgi:hypothetical protein
MLDVVMLRVILLSAVVLIFDDAEGLKASDDIMLGNIMLAFI